MTASRKNMPDWLANIPSPQVRELDPRRHALIEASAGTGKTYAIERLVLRLLMENPAWKPEEILVLSFTEKTVAELRARIRDLLRAQVDGSDPKKRVEGWSADDLTRIREAWLHADDLSVHTLHAFCQSAVRRDPVANDALIRTELTDDRIVADRALDRLLREAWPADLARLARLADALGIGASDGWRKKIVRLALAWQPWRFDTIEPARDPGTLDAVEAEAARAARALQAAIVAVEQSAYPITAHRRSFAFTATGRARKDPEAARGKDPWEKVFRFTEERPADPDHPAWHVDIVSAFFAGFRGNTRVISQGWHSELPEGARGLQEWVRLAEACQAARDAGVARAEALRLQRLGLVSEAAQELRAALDAEKLRSGRISYEDMPRRLAEALRRNPGLAARLRSRYKACIVDEFQDTDPLQWEILERLCLQPENGHPGAGEENPLHRSTLPELPLFLVGDPKQAIYAFRGGDLRTYMRARERFLALATQGRAQGIGLDANYRSRPGLVEALNAVFAHEEWFGPPPVMSRDPSWQLSSVTDGIAFTRVQAGRKDGGDAGPAILLRDLSETFVDGAGKQVFPKKTTLEATVRSWIVARIGEALQEKDGAQPGDFAVLARGNAEAEAIARLLRRRGIPCRIRRKQGPFHGPAADALRLLLEWIDAAGDPDTQARILLLPFARRDEGDAPRGRPLRCPPLISRWASLARAGRWPEFLLAVLHDGGFRERLAESSEADAARFDRLVEILAEAGSAPGTTTRALCERFDALRGGEEDAGGEEEEADGEAGSKEGFVTVMTLHLSKGLEFRHVFIAATGGGSRRDFLVLRDPAAPGFRIVLDKDDEAGGEQAAREADEEDRRLFYVAFTRARETLHVPLLPEKLARGSSGPLGGFAATALRALAADATNRSIRFDDAEVREAPGPATARKNGSGRTDAPDSEDLLVATRSAFERRRRVTSYSRLARHAEAGAPQETPADPLLEEDGTRALREEPAPEAVEEAAEVVTQDSAAGISATELPPGAAAGTALHALLEHTEFASTLEADDADSWLASPGTRERMEEALRREGVDPAHAPAAARAIWNALRSPLPVPESGDTVSTETFRLAELPPKDLRHEVEFLLPFASAARADGALPEGFAWRDGEGGTFLWGFIDLVFRRDGRYYLLDWKSNLLPAYDDASVRTSMEQHRYDLQWKLYSVALDRWLDARLPGYDPAEHFGGVCYLYLRGATPDRFSGFAYRPVPRELRDDYPREISALLGGPAEASP
ncbi:MAG TPA: UvrD-helicase domain-containing protein [Fibrobacteria bacterium]|nr:UvrD-helicase domain-containing protein [Fibrobacteria bacterium]